MNKFLVAFSLFTFIGVVGGTELSAQLTTQSDKTKVISPTPAPAPEPYSLLVTNQTIFGPDEKSAGYQQTISVAGRYLKKIDADVIIGSKVAEDLASSDSPESYEVVQEDGGGSPQTATVRVLAAEITYGPNGPQIPTRLDYEQINSQIITPLFGGGDIVVCETEDPGEPCSNEVIQLVPGEEIRFIGKSAYPSFANPMVHYEVPSDDLVYAALLVNGDNYHTIAAQKGIHDPFGSQQTLKDILGANVIDPVTGHITLPENQVIAIFELGTANPNHPAFDFNDIVMRITTEYGNQSEVLLRDSVGVDNSSTNGNLSFSATRVTGGAWYSIPVEISPSEDIILKSFRGIAGQTTSLLDLSRFDYTLRVWSSVAAAVLNPALGDIANQTFANPSEGPTPFGEQGNQAIGIKPTYDLAFDLEALQIAIPAGQTYVVSIEFLSIGGTGLSGTFGWVESTESGASDRQYGWDIPGGWRYVSSSSRSSHDGRIGFEVRGVTTQAGNGN